MNEFESVCDFMWTQHNNGKMEYGGVEQSFYIFQSA